MEHPSRQTNLNSRARQAILHLAAILLILISTSSCDTIVFLPHLGSNLPYYGNNDYQKGYHDGCATFTILMTKGPARFVPIEGYLSGWKLTGKHPDISNQEAYLAGFLEALDFCTYNLDPNVL